MLVLEECGAECDGVVRAGVSAPAKAGGYAVDGKAGFDLGSDDVAGSIVGGTEVLAGGEAQRRGRGTRVMGRDVAGDGSNLGQREVAACEGDGGTGAGEGQRGRGGGGETHR